MGEDGGEQTQASRSSPAASVSQSDPRGVVPAGQSPGEKPPACGHRSAGPCADLGASMALGAHLRPGRPSPTRPSACDVEPWV